jgi:hypothetical protein
VAERLVLFTSGQQEKKYCGRNQMGTLARCPTFFFVNDKHPVEFVEYTAAVWTTTIKWNSSVNYPKLSMFKQSKFRGVASHRLTMITSVQPNR